MSVERELRAPRMAGKIVFITAAAQGIGAASARALAREGATVVVSDVQTEKVKALAEEIGGVGLSLDVCDEAGWLGAARTVKERFGRLDTLVHNAGWAVQKPFWEYSLREWRRHMEMNLEPGFIGTQAFFELLKQGARERSSYSSIVFIASLAGALGAQNQVPYNTSKAGVRHLSKSLSVEFATHGIPIRVNAVLPGVIDTAILKNWFRQAAEQGVLGDGTTEEKWQRLTMMAPMRRLGSPVEVANAVLYLASDESIYVNGTDFMIDGCASAV